jgi:crotonobetainyl-CoA:carnitine CoA-transferase CaiB-like acyl-CoA transferase
MALGLLAAVHRVQICCQGEFFDVAMYDSMLTLLKSNVAAYSLTGKQSKPGKKALVPFDLFSTVVGRIAIAAPVERHWQALCHAMAREDLISNDRTRSNRRRAAYQDFIEAQISAWTSVKSKADILASIGGNVPCFPANTMAEVFADPHVAARNMIERYQMQGDNPEVALSANPIKFQRSKTALYQAPPRLGEHTEEILAEFGIRLDET